MRKRTLKQYTQRATAFSAVITQRYMNHSVFQIIYEAMTVRSEKMLLEAMKGETLLSLTSETWSI